MARTPRAEEKEMVIQDLMEVAVRKNGSKITKEVFKEWFSHKPSLRKDQMVSLMEEETRGELSANFMVSVGLAMRPI